MYSQPSVHAPEQAFQAWRANPDAPIVGPMAAMLAGKRPAGASVEMSEGNAPAVVHCDDSDSGGWNFFRGVLS